MSQGGTRPYGHQGLVDGGAEVPGGFKGLCDDDPLPVGGAASPGTSQYASRCDHVHPSGELPLFNLALSYGQGPAGAGDLNAGEIFWHCPQGANANVEADQVREWPIARALAYVGLIVWVDAAEIILAEGGDDPRFIVTVDGVDTILQLVLTEGTHAGGELLSTGAFIDVAANSRIGVRFDGSGLDTGCSLRCEMMLDGAGSGSPVPPPPIPTSGLLADWASENYVLAIESGPNLRGTWTDASGNGNTLFTGLGSDPTAFPQTEANAFNDDPGVTFVRGVTSSPPTTSFNPYVWYAPNTPRTIAMVVRGDNLSVGNLLDVSGSHVYVLQGGTLPQPAYIQCDPMGSIFTNTTVFQDINNQKAVLMWWTEGGIGDAWHFTVNGVEVPLDSLVGTEPAHINLGIGRGTFIDLAATLMADASFARVLGWNRVLTPAERIGVLSNLTARYL